MSKSAKSELIPIFQIEKKVCQDVGLNPRHSSPKAEDLALSHQIFAEILLKLRDPMQPAWMYLGFKRSAWTWV